MSLGGSLGGPMTAFQYDWNMLPIGQQLWMEQLMSYEKFPPLQAPETYNLTGILEKVKALVTRGTSRRDERDLTQWAPHHGAPALAAEKALPLPNS